MTTKFINYSPKNSLGRELLKIHPYYRRDNLVYAPLFKVASSYYTTLLEHNGWEQVNYPAIDWNHDHVFGFIMDPVKRYFKGIVEDLQKNITNGIEFIENNEDNISTENHFMLLSHHALPISMTHRDHYYAIDWIPLETEEGATHHLKNLLKAHNIELDVPANLNVYQSSDEKVEMYEYLRELWRDNNVLLLHLLKDDIELYNRVMRRFTPEREARGWNKVSWLQ